MRAFELTQILGQPCEFQVAAAGGGTAAGASSFTNALHNEVAGWLGGSLPAPPALPPSSAASSKEVGLLAAVALDAASEVERFDAATTLGQLARQGGGASIAAAVAVAVGGKVIQC
jgi:hypothetical protein